MNTYQRNLLFYILGFIVTVLILVNTPNSCQFSEIIKDVLVGIISALLLLMAMELRDFLRDRSQYGYLDGKYKREARYNENKDKTVDTKWVIVDTRDCPDITMVYKGNREYKIPTIHYDEQWIATATIFLDATNKKSGSGIYQYIKKSDSFKTDFGTYQLFVDELDERRLYIFHQNYLPSGLSVGYEIFVKQ